MPRNTSPISKKVIKNIFKELGANRVSDKALKLLVEHFENKVKETTKISEKIAKHSNRTTILEKDVKLASKKIFKTK